MEQALVSARMLKKLRVGISFKFQPCSKLKGSEQLLFFHVLICQIKLDNFT